MAPTKGIPRAVAKSLKIVKHFKKHVAAAKKGLPAPKSSCGCKHMDAQMARAARKAVKSGTADKLPV
jgi:hypothetical protein